MLADSEYIRIVDWDRHQHYKKRRPPWIKLYRDVLTDYDVTGLEPWERWCLVGLWLLASETDNQIPADLDWLRARLVVDKDPPLAKLEDLGMIEVGESARESLSKSWAQYREEREKRESTPSSPSLRSGSSGGASPDVENSPDVEKAAENGDLPWGDFVAELKPVVRERLWKDDEPPARSPPEWDMRREISVWRRWHDQGHDLEDLLGAARCYDGPAMSAAAWEKRGNRGTLNRLIGEHRRREETRTPSIGEILQDAS